MSKLPPLYDYIAGLVRTYPFTQYIMSYLTGWHEELSKAYNDPFLNEIAAEALADEKGHDRLILRDLQDLGIPVQIALDRFPSESVKRCIAAFAESVARDPLHFLAWLFYVENRAVNTVTEQVLEQYQKMLGPLRKASRFWQVHSVKGPEVDHVAKRLEWIEALPAHQKNAVTEELKRVDAVLTSQTYDLNFKEFEDFLNEHAPHLFEIAYHDRIKALNQLSFATI